MQHTTVETEEGKLFTLGLLSTIVDNFGEYDEEKYLTMELTKREFHALSGLVAMSLQAIKNSNVSNMKMHLKWSKNL